MKYICISDYLLNGSFLIFEKGKKYKYDGYYLTALTGSLPCGISAYNITKNDLDKYFVSALCYRIIRIKKILNENRK